MKTIRTIFKYLEPMWLGADGKISLRAVLAMFFSWKLVDNLDYGVRKWAADRSLEGLNSLILVLAGLIAALLGIAAWSNMTAKKIDTDASMPNTSSVITVQKAETVTSAPPAKEGTTTNSTQTTTTTNTSGENPNIEPSPEDNG
jgi:hypothetical protein